MCGIIGALKLSKLESDYQSNIGLMASFINHRGPNASGIWCDESSGIALGHVRLSILELTEAGAQPMHSACDRFVLSFNGEIYNHLKLRAQLEHEGHFIQWRGHSDTETLLACFSIWGIEKTLQATVGMFAIALLDRQKIHFSSHDAHLYNALKMQKIVEYNLLCGTNCLSSRMWYRPSWAVNIFTAKFIKPTITLGVGWGAYQNKPDLYTKFLLNKLLCKESLLSVRDEYTKNKLEEAGFDNVINTSCLTMWTLNSEKCDLIKRISPAKAEKVIYTLTDYAKDYSNDFETIKILSKNYSKVLIWIQGARDWNYLKELVYKNSDFFKKNYESISIIPPSLQRYDSILEEGNVDYVGTRLHGGIRALQKNVRTLIIGVDNRAIEKKKDFNLPVVEREMIVDQLEIEINRPYDLNINLPESNIEKFKLSLKSYNDIFRDDFDLVKTY